MSVVVEEKPEEDAMYMCKCCKSIHSKKEYPPIAGMCPECHKSKGETLNDLYNLVERALSHVLQPGVGYREIIAEVTEARRDLRRIMCKMGWQGQF